MEEDLVINNFYAKVIYEGLYFFGGKNNNNQCLNSLMILNIHHDHPIWIKPECHGKPPSPRFIN